MEHILFGFGTEMNRYVKMEVFLYLIVFAVMLELVGKAAFQRRRQGQGLWLIRYGSFLVWWRRTVLWILAIGQTLVLLLFGAGACIMELTGVERTREEWIGALLLWSVGFCTAALVQTAFIQCRNGYKMVFAMFMCGMVVSLYFFRLPGSWLMYERSGLATDSGFSVWMSCGIQIGLDLWFGLVGHLLWKPRRSHEASD